MVIWTWVMTAAIAALVAPARAQPMPGAGGFGTESHGWVLLPASGRSGVQLFHIPPRGGGGGAGPGVVPDGAAPMVRVIERPPEAIAAWENRVYLAFPAEQPRPGQVQRRVLSLRATRTPLGDSWGYQDPRAARLDALAPIPGEAPLAGFVGSPRGPVALLSAESGFTLLVLSDVGWARLPLPETEGEPLSRAARLRLIGTEHGPGLLVGGERPGVWTAEWSVRRTVVPTPIDESADVDADTPVVPVPETVPDWPGADRPSWRWTPLALRGIPQGDGAAYWVQGRLVVTRWTRATGLAVWVADGAGAHRVAEIKDCPPVYAAAPLEGAGRLTVMWAMREAARRTAPRAGGAPILPEQRYHIAEVSVLTGRVLYAAPWTATSPISPKEFRGLVLVLVAVMALILLFVFRPRSVVPPVALPGGLALAEPSRRVAGAFIDLLPSLFLASQISGVPIADAFTLGALLGDSGAILLVGDALGIAWVHTTVCEWLFGRSLGKALSGCEVGRSAMVRDPLDGMLSPGFTRLSLVRAAMRNLIKWGLPPVALFGLGTPEHRHAGDAAAGAVVVVRYVPEASGDEPPDG